MPLLYLVLSVLFIVVATVRLKLHPFLALIGAALLFGLLNGMSSEVILESISEGFGGTIGNIGIVIVAGTMIGTFLERSGGAFALAEKLIKGIGMKHIYKVLSFIGWIVSIPVFCDSAFVVLLPLTKALSKRAGISLAGSAIALALGLFAAHTLVPPTPGPTAAAGIVGANLGLVIGLGIPVSLLAVVSGWIFSRKVASKVYIDPVPDLTPREMDLRLEHAPSWGKALLPIIVPLVLIMLKSFSTLQESEGEQSALHDMVSFVGDPGIALLIGLMIAFTLPRKFKLDYLSSSGWIGKGLLDAAIIIMITGAGGIFGKTLQNSDIMPYVQSFFSGGEWGLILPFLIATILKTSQGSSTVAIITTASIVAPLVGVSGYHTEIDKALLVLAIGAGAAVVSHANDSFFWIVTQMSGMRTKDGYRLLTPGSLAIGLTAMLGIVLLSVVL